MSANSAAPSSSFESLNKSFAICSHPQAAAITASLDLIGTRKTARQFHVSLPAVNRHKQHVREEREAQ